MSGDRNQAEPVDVSITFAMHSGDLAKEIELLSLLEKGAYYELRRLLSNSGGRLPLEPERLRRAIGAEPAEWEAVWPPLHKTWFPEVDGYIVHRRQLAEIERARGIKVKRTEAGRAGGLAKGKQTPSKPLASGQANDPAKAYPPTPTPDPTPDPSPSPTPSPGLEDSAEPTADGAALAPAEPPLLVFPCAGKNKSWALTETIRAELAEAYPGVDVIAVARRALEWCRANPTKIKTAKRMRGWLGGQWCGGDQDRGGRQGPAAPVDIRHGRYEPPRTDEPVQFGKVEL